MVARVLSSTRGIRFFPLLLAACLMFAGCADTTKMSPAQRALEQSKRRFVVTTAEGALGGAALGALIGGLAGGGRGALIGAAGGGLAGGVAGAMVAQNNYARTHSEADLNQLTADANQQAAQAQQDANTASEIANEVRAKTAQLRAQYRAGQINAAQYHAQLASYSGSLKSLREISEGQATQIAAYRGDISSAGAQGGQLAQASNSIARSKDAVDRSIHDVAAALAAEPG